MANLALPFGTASASQRSQLLKTADARLNPSFRDPNFLVLRSRRLILQRWVTQLEGSELKVLDVGGRYQPYRPLFEGRAAKYVACDIRQTELVDIVGTGESLPFSPSTFDVVVATQVFEYFSQPQIAAEQIYHVLKPGGSLLMSVASFAPRFVEEERWRFTLKGIRALLSPFSEVKIVPEVSSVGGVLRTMNLAINTFVRYRKLRTLAEFAAFPFLNLLGLGIEALAITNNDQFTPNYSVLAVK